MKSLILMLVLAEIALAGTSTSLSGSGVCVALQKAISLGEIIQYVGTAAIALGGLGVAAMLAWRERIPTAIGIGGFSIILAGLFFFVAPLLEKGLTAIKNAFC